ncbi:transcriptional regulator [Kribbella sp. CA-247076]|uniref:transcriptional regulator n=1 Tax=Kribbella sp. CA-247076 TaxID=3239941 RepID=UPI003D921897
MTALLVLHGVRLKGFADTHVIADRFHLKVEEAEQTLRDAEARGWVQHSAFVGTEGWSLTDQGRAENERLLAVELADAGGAGAVRTVYRDFLPLNALVQQACTDWQLRPTATDPLAPNDHSDPAWDDGVLHELSVVERALTPLTDRLTAVLPRFRGYDARFSRALARARAGDTTWIDRSDVDSCHRAWFELHEDLLATLNLDRGQELVAEGLE